MLHPEVEALLNEQVALEAQASFKYLTLATWCDMKGFNGTAKFLYEHSDEERMHMMKLVNYVVDMGGNIVIPAVVRSRDDFSSIKELLEYAYAGEQEVTAAIHRIVSLTVELKDHTTNNFIQWYVTEQLEEENLYRTILDRVQLIGEGGNALYLIDTEIEKLSNGDGGMAVIDSEA